MLSLSEIASKLFRLGFSSYDVEYMGAGAKRAAIREDAHSKAQAARVAPALPAFAERRAELAKRRVKRWQLSVGRRDLSTAPGHIKRMSREQVAR